MPIAARDPELPAALAAPVRPASSIGLPVALAGACALHLLLILGVSFRMPNPPPELPPETTLEVSILRHSGVAPPTPDPRAALSQLSRAGESPDGSGALTSREGIEPDPSAEEPPSPAPAVDGEPRPPPQEDAQPASTPASPDDSPLAAEPLANATPTAPLDAPEPKTVDAARLLASRDREIAQLTASLEARTAAYASRPRRRSVSASTREFRYASYLGAWARKVENIGNLNFPREAKERQIYGSLILHVAVRRDGSIESVRIVRSSGYALLDDAAVRIVQLASPFAPFPPDIAADTDVLDIVRTWQFLRGGRLGWE